MLKSTRIKLAQNAAMIAAEEKAVAAQRAHNQIYEKDVEETKRHNKFEEETKDRVDVAKKEYLALLADKEELAREKATLDRIFRCFYQMKFPEALIQDFFDGKFEIDVRVTKEPVECKTKITLSFDVNDIKYFYQ